MTDVAPEPTPEAETAPSQDPVEVQTLDVDDVASVLGVDPADAGEPAADPDVDAPDKLDIDEYDPANPPVDIDWDHISEHGIVEEPAAEGARGSRTVERDENGDPVSGQQQQATAEEREAHLAEQRARGNGGVGPGGMTPPNAPAEAPEADETEAAPEA